MSASDRIPGPATESGAARPAGKREKVWQKQKESSSTLLFGLFFLLLIFFFLAAVVLAILFLGQPWLDQHNVQQDGYSSGGMPVSPTIIVRPDVAPNMFVQEKLKMTEPIVGQWKSLDIELYGYTYPRVSDNFYLTVYNDNTFIIHDGVNDTYTVGKWIKVSSPEQYAEYSAIEPGRIGPIAIIGGSDSLQFQYKNYGYVTYLRR